MSRARKKKKLISDNRFVWLFEMFCAFLIGCLVNGICGYQFGKYTVQQQAVEIEYGKWTEEGDFIWEGIQPSEQPDAKWWQFLKRWRSK